MQFTPPSEYENTIYSVFDIGHLHYPTIVGMSAGEPLGRVKMELFADTTPRTAENFRQFCTGETKNSQGRPQGYKGSKFHRVVCCYE